MKGALLGQCAVNKSAMLGQKIIKMERTMQVYLSKLFFSHLCEKIGYNARNITGFTQAHMCEYAEGRLEEIKQLPIKDGAAPYKILENLISKMEQHKGSLKTVCKTLEEVLISVKNLTGEQSNRLAKIDVATAYNTNGLEDTTIKYLFNEERKANEKDYFSMALILVCFQKNQDVKEIIELFEGSFEIFLKDIQRNGYRLMNEITEEYLEHVTNVCKNCCYASELAQVLVAVDELKVMKSEEREEIDVGVTTDTYTSKNTIMDVYLEAVTFLRNDIKFIGEIIESKKMMEDYVKEVENAFQYLNRRKHSNISFLKDEFSKRVLMGHLYANYRVRKEICVSPEQVDYVIR